MNIVLFAHPKYPGIRSMAAFTDMLADGMRKRGHNVEVWTSGTDLSRIPVFFFIKKWLGYVDQYLIYPKKVASRISLCKEDTLFVFTDHALGPWVPLVSGRHQVIHCHDFLAQLSALGKIRENAVSWTGRMYQAYIRKGFKKGRNFISVSNKTKSDLHEFIGYHPQQSEVVYNGVNKIFKPCDNKTAGVLLSNKTQLQLTTGFLLHVGSDEWYKNRDGVIEIYDELRKAGGSDIPLVMIGALPGEKLLKRKQLSQFKNDIHFITNLDINYLRLAYCCASALLFPSLGEGFGWPIAEAMACGCPVITTNEAPMTEVASNAGFFIPRRPSNSAASDVWARTAAATVRSVLTLSLPESEQVSQKAIANAQRFDADTILDRIENIYKKILALEKNR